MAFRDQVVWVTGASSGIGEAVARELARKGARLVLSARREGELNRVKHACERPAEHLVYPVDLSRVDRIESAVEDVRARIGEIDVLIHASGLSQRDLAERTRLEVDRRIMEINYFAAVALAKALLPSMLARGRGHLVPISSVSGKVGVPYRTAYCASKHALHGFFDALRTEVHDRGLKVTIACPGYVRTSVSVNALIGDGRPFGITDRDIARGISPEECAAAIVRGIERGDEEVLVGGAETLIVYVKRLLPSLASKLIRRAKKVSPEEPSKVRAGAK